MGLLLIVLPWSAFWESNYFASIWPALLPVMTNDFVRGAVSGIGLINLGSGVAELVVDICPSRVTAGPRRTLGRPGRFPEQSGQQDRTLIVHLVTDRRRISTAADDAGEACRCVIRQATYAVEAGIDYIQVREHDLPASTLAALVTEIVALAAGSSTRVLVSDRLDVALACGAAGVHLRGDSFGACDVRPVAPEGFLIGRSVHTAADVSCAEGADYLIAGTIWPTASKGPNWPLLGVSGLSAIVTMASVPVIGIGGVNLDNLAGVAATGAAGIAAIGLFVGADDSRGLPGDPAEDNRRNGARPV